MVVSPATRLLTGEAMVSELFANMITPPSSLMLIFSPEVKPEARLPSAVIPSLELSLPSEIAAI